MAKTFSPSNSALVLIDHQYGTMQLIKNLPVEQVKRNTLALAAPLRTGTPESPGAPPTCRTIVRRRGTAAARASPRPR
jgi:nicotinamidase-related amidase